MHTSRTGLKPFDRALGLLGRALRPALLGSLLAATALPLVAAAQEVPTDRLVTIVAEVGGTYTRTFNPFSPNSRWASTRAMYEPLMIQNFATGKLEPWLATEFAWSADTKELTLTLRDGVKWSDGTPMTAKDVVFTFELLRDNQGLIGPASGIFSTFLDAVSAPDDKTVKFTFKQPYTPGLFNIVDQFIVPQHIWADVKDPVTFENPDPVATGPFTTIAAFSPQQYQITRNPNYWQDIKIEGINVPSFQGNDAISAAVLAGQIDWGGLVPDPDVTFVPRDPEHFGYWWPRMSVVYLMANTTNPVLGDVNVRKAMSLVLDRQRMINTGVWGKSVPANATGLPVGPFQAWIDQSVVDAGSSWIGTDVDKANAMLDEAGYKKGSDGVRTDKDGKPLAFDIIVPSGWNDWVSASQIVAENLNDIGIKVQLRTTTADSWTSSTYTGQFQLSLNNAQPTATPFEFYRNVMSTQTVKPVGTASPFNQQRYGDPAIDELLSQFAANPDQDQQKKIVAEIEAKFSEQAPVIPLYEQPDWGLYNTNRFTGFPMADNPYAPLNLRAANTPLLVFPHLEHR